MLRWRGLSEVPSGWGRCVVTIGVFDGVHRGHAQLIGRAVARARERGVPCVLVTFDPHPAELVRPGSHPAQLTTLARRADLVEALGVDAFCVLPFTRDLAAVPPEDFVHQVLVERLHAADVVVGQNFTFGHKAAGDVDMLARLGTRYGFTVDSEVLLTDGSSGGGGGGDLTVSSTYVRSCVDAGDVVAASAALGRPHRVEGVVVRGDGRGRGLGYPTANVAPPMHSAIPGDGVYAAWFTVLGAGPVTGTVVAGQRCMAAVSIGTNPTFSGRARTVEAFVLDSDADLYGQHVAVDFVARLRGMESFSSVEALLEAMAGDTERARTVLADHPA